MHDVIIIGGGPAAMTAAIYGARKKIDVLMITPEIGGQASWALDVENYLGFTMISVNMPPFASTLSAEDSVGTHSN
jgi:alkyl hydroperoxide reductase subunit F